LEEGDKDLRCQRFRLGVAWAEPPPAGRRRHQGEKRGKNEMSKVSRVESLVFIRGLCGP
jgi:hypothetical protein